MKMLLIVLSVLMMAGPAWSNISPDPDVMGLYFDTEANEYCVEGISPFSTHTVFLIYTNPTPDAIWAFRAGIEIEGLMLVLSSTSPCDPIIVDGTIQFECGWNEPEPTTQTMILASFAILYMDTTMDPLYFYLGSYHDPMEGVPSVMLPDQTWMEADLFFEDGLVATLNTPCVTAVEPSTFDSLKAMYR